MLKKDVRKNNELLRELYDKYRGNFASGFHGLLWHLIFEDAWAGKLICLYPTITSGTMLAVVAANESGYYATTAYFIGSLAGRQDERHYEIANDLNERLFGLPAHVCEDISTSSFAAKADAPLAKNSDNPDVIDAMAMYKHHLALHNLDDDSDTITVDALMSYIMDNISE